MSMQRACDTDDEPTEEPSPPTDQPQWITPREAARRANVPPRTLYNWIRSGKWPVRVVRYSESTYQVRLDEFEAWLAARRAERDE